MRKRREPTPFRCGRKSAFEVAVLERLHRSTPLAHHVVVVVSTRPDRLETRPALAQLNPLCHPQVFEQLQRSVDAGEAEVGALGPCGVVEVARRGGTAALGQGRDHRRARTSESIATAAQHIAGVLRPLLRRARRSLL